MHDLVIRGGMVVDGTGAPARLADVAIDGGLISKIGQVSTPGRREIDATGLLVTPGWVDIHTHYDGQVTWDPYLSPSCWHGVTTVVMMFVLWLCACAGVQAITPAALMTMLVGGFTSR